jgi:hypothetical protein
MPVHPAVRQGDGLEDARRTIPEHRHAFFTRADPHVAVGVLNDGGDRSAKRHVNRLEAAIRIPHHVAVVEADPQHAGAILDEGGDVIGS